MVLKFRQDAKLDPAMVLKLIKSRRDLTLLPPAVLRLALSGGQAEQVRAESQRKGTGKPAASWWTARAASGVAPGFNRESMTAEMRPNPSEPGGLFERLGELLEQLSQSLVTG